MHHCFVDVMKGYHIISATFKLKMSIIRIRTSGIGELYLGVIVGVIQILVMYSFESRSKMHCWLKRKHSMSTLKMPKIDGSRRKVRPGFRNPWNRDLSPIPRVGVNPKCDLPFRLACQQT